MSSNSDPAEATNPPREPAGFTWRSSCPWLMIFRALPVACSPTVVILAMIACVLTPVGWMVSERIFVTEEMRTVEPGLEEELKINRSPYRAVFPDETNHWAAVNVLGYNLQGLDLVFLNHVNPPTQLTQIDAGWRRFGYFGVGWIWMILIWSFFATAITRVAALRFTQGEIIGLDDAVEYAIWKFPASFSGIALPLLGVLLILIPIGLLGLLLKFDLGTVILGAVWFIVLLLGLLIGLLLLGLLFSWPLIISSVSVEGQDSFDAMSRSFAYSLRRPVHYLFYVVVALIFGGVVWFVVSQFTDGVIHLSHWGASFGANIGADRMDLIQANSVEDVVREPSSSLELGRKFIRFWNGFARTIGAAFMHGLFWCVATAVYLLLRKDLDQIEMDEILLVEPFDADDLPELAIDEDGLPSPESQADNTSSKEKPDSGQDEKGPARNSEDGRDPESDESE